MKTKPAIINILEILENDIKLMRNLYKNGMVNDTALLTSLTEIFPANLKVIANLIATVDSEPIIPGAESWRI